MCRCNERPATDARALTGGIGLVASTAELTTNSEDAIARLFGVFPALRVACEARSPSGNLARQFVTDVERIVRSVECCSQDHSTSIDIEDVEALLDHLPVSTLQRGEMEERGIESLVALVQNGASVATLLRGAWLRPRTPSPTLGGDPTIETELLEREN